MDIKSIIAALANDADTILDGIADRKEARTTLQDYLASHYPRLSGVEYQKIADGVMAILEREDFFQAGKRGDSWEEEGETAEEG